MDFEKVIKIVKETDNIFFSETLKSRVMPIMVPIVLLG